MNTWAMVNTAIVAMASHLARLDVLVSTGIEAMGQHLAKNSVCG